MREPLKPWRAQRAEGNGLVHWYVHGGCPLTHGCGDGEDDGCFCQACNCEHCEGGGLHILASHVTEEEARLIAAMGTLVEVERYLLTLGDRFVYFPRTAEEAAQNGIRQKVISHNGSADELVVFPEYARYREAV